MATGIEMLGLLDCGFPFLYLVFLLVVESAAEHISMALQPPAMWSLFTQKQIPLEEGLKYLEMLLKAEQRLPS